MAHIQFQRFVVSATLVALSASSTRLLSAQTDEERAGARAAADAGLKAYDAKKWSECVDLFTRAESLVHAPPHQLYIARCSASIGRLVKAREAYLKVKNEVIAPDKPKTFHDAKTTAEKELAALEPRVPYLNVQVKGATKGITVTMDGVTVPPALVGVPRPVDPGEHKVQANADGMASKLETVMLNEGQSQTLTLELVASAAPQPVASHSSDSADDGSRTAPETPPPGRDRPPLRTIGFVTLGVGVVGLVAGGVFLAQSSSSKSDADAKFEEYKCSGGCTIAQQAEINDLDDRAATKKTVAFVSGGIGLAAVGVGLALIFMGTGSGASSEAKGPKVTPMIGFGTLGLSGTF